ncbi:MAG: glycoside hydrolase family 3 C-terminal domain-containing protein [Bryobacteraceae bacterium]
MNRDRLRIAAIATIAGAAILLQGAICASGQAGGQGASPAPARPWMDKTLPPDKRADLVIQEMTLDEKVQFLHGDPDRPVQAIGGAVWIPGIPRLGIPDFQMTDGRSGVRVASNRGRYATALPSSLAAGASWDVKLAYDYGAIIGKEARDLGYNVSLGGTANLIREPRNGRNFECWGEDPLLIGKMLAQEVKGTQDQHVVGNINRYVVNDQETGRQVYTSTIDKRSLWETDLLAFEIAIKESNVGTVMCAFNKVNGVHACENPYLLTDILKKAWGFPGWVMSDGGAVVSTVPSAMAGLDQEMVGSRNYYFGDLLKAAIEQGNVPISRVNDMVHRIFRTAFAIGIYDDPPVLRPVNPFPGAEVAQRVAEQGMTLLKNAGGLLPLRAAAVKSIAVIGSHADAGVLSGGGSDQVSAAGGNAVPPPPGGRGGAVWHPSPPLAAIRAKAPNAKVEYDPGTDVAAAAKLAAASDVAIVFGNQRTSEGRDVPNLSLPENQDALIAAVTGANAHTIVVLETGGPVTMPWVDKASAVLEAWYPGIRGGEAMANILFGSVNPSGRLPVTFPKSEADLPHPVLPGPPAAAVQPAPAAAQTGAPGAAGQGRGRGPQVPFDVNYTEGLKAGYKWFDAENKEPLFPFGFGLSYTTFSYSQLKAAATGQSVTVSFQVRNTGKVRGAEVAQVYVALPASAGEPPRRLAGWDKVLLAPGESKTVSVTLDPLRLSIFNVDKDAWEVVPGEYKILVGSSSRNTPLSETVRIAAAR